MVKIHCTVFRKNGTYKTVSVKAGKEDFELDGKKYQIKHYYIGKLLGLHILRALYLEGYPLPLQINIDEEMKNTKYKKENGETYPFRIDCKAIKNLTNKKILDVFGDEELTRLEKLLLMVAVGVGAIGVINVILTMNIMNALGI